MSNKKCFLKFRDQIDTHMNGMNGVRILVKKQLDMSICSVLKLTPGRPHLSIQLSGSSNFVRYFVCLRSANMPSS